jgi:hypothetical protein
VPRSRAFPDLDGAAIPLAQKHPMIVRPTQKLAAKIKAGPLLDLDLPKDPLQDWSGTIFKVGRESYLLICHTESLYGCVLRASGLNTVMKFEVALEEVIWGVIGSQNSSFARAIRGYSEWQYAKSLNRSVIGSMVDLVFAAQFMIEEGVPLAETSERLNGTPLKALTNSNGRRYAAPNEVFRTTLAKANQQEIGK